MKFINPKNILFALTGLAVAGVITVAASTTNADFTAASVNFPAKHTDGSIKNLTASGIAENLSSNGTYSVTYRIKSNGENVDFPLKSAIHKCAEGNGHRSLDGLRFPVCEQADAVYSTGNISLNASNNYTQDVTVSTTQNNSVPCGSFQSDLFSNTPTPNANGFFYASIKFTGKDLASCIPVSSPSPSPSPSPTPSPSVTPSPTPSPSPSASTVQCPVGKVSKVVDSTIICVAQNQEQAQVQVQSNDQNQNVNQTVNATGGSSSSSSSSSSSVNLTVNNPATTTTNTVVVPATVTKTPQVVMQTKGDVKELPKTGLPLAALALGGLLPAGFGLKKFAKKDGVEENANSIWTKRQLGN